MELIGDGCPIDSQKQAIKTAAKAAKATGSPAAKGKGSPGKVKKLPDPISESFDVRRNDGGSHLSVVTKARGEFLEVTKLGLVGPGCNPVADMP